MCYTHARDYVPAIQVKHLASDATAGPNAQLTESLVVLPGQVGAEERLDLDDCVLLQQKRVNFITGQVTTVTSPSNK